MGFFDDKTYENLDWLSKATLPITFSGNTQLQSMPNEITVSNTIIADMVHDMVYGYTRHSVGKLIRIILQSPEYSTDDHESFPAIIGSCYKLESDGGIIDINNNIFPVVKVVKIKNCLSEKEIIEYVTTRTHRTQSAGAHINASYMNEILDIVDYKPNNGKKNARKSRNGAHKLKAIADTLNAIFKENRWQIYNADLMLSLIEWIYHYICDGNLAALTNITKLKIMTHRKTPIYSIVEAV